MGRIRRRRGSQPPEPPVDACHGKPDRAGAGEVENRACNAVEPTEGKVGGRKVGWGAGPAGVSVSPVLTEVRVLAGTLWPNGLGDCGMESNMHVWWFGRRPSRGAGFVASVLRIASMACGVPPLNNDPSDRYSMDGSTLRTGQGFSGFAFPVAPGFYLILPCVSRLDRAEASRVKNDQ